MRETLDEAIDRVASTLTTVSSNAGIADRVRDRLDRRPSRGPLWLVAATATGVLLATLLIDPKRGVERPAIEVTSTAPAATAVAPPRNEPSIPSDVEASGSGSAIRRTPVAIELPPPPAIAALTVPSSLSVEELEVESLAIAPVDVAHLDELAALELAALEQQESR
jgi:hypothetical protein